MRRLPLLFFLSGILLTSPGQAAEPTGDPPVDDGAVAASEEEATEDESARRAEQTAAALRGLAESSISITSEERTYAGDPIDLSLRDAPLQEVLRTFARIGGFDLIVDPAVDGTVTVELKGVPWDQALEQILKVNGLGMEITGNVVGVSRR